MSLPPSVVTGIMTPVINGVVAPVENTVNPILGVLGGLLPLVPPLSIDTTTLLANAAAGDPITLQVLNADGVVVGPADRCDVQADSFQLNTPQGIAIGGNRITGLGATGQEATAGEINSIAFGNRASTDLAAGNALAIGPDALVGPGGTGSIALGSGANLDVANSVALGAGSTATRGPLAGYTALGLAGTQDSVGEVSIGAPGALRQLTNVAAGSAPTDAANIAQLAAVSAQVAAVDSNAVHYDSATHDTITLDGAAGTRITNVAPATLSATSTDAVNGAQLYATNQAVADNTTAITNLAQSITNGAAGPVQYSNPATPTVPNGGTPTNDLTLVGGAAGPVALHNVADGAIAPGSTDAVNGGQVYALAGAAVNAVTYDTDGLGNRTNTVTLAGGNSAAPVTIGNVADGTVAAGSTQAVNGGQLYQTNQSVTTAQTTANTALTLGQNSVQYSNNRSTVIFNPGGSATTLSNVGPGVAPTDAVNVAQLNTAMNTAVTQANSYTDARLNSLSYDLREVRRQGFAGTAGALAAAGLPQAYEAGKGMIAIAMGAYMDATAVAFGFSKAFNDGHTVVKLAGTYDSQQRAGASAGVGYQF